ncbi:MAG: hypothetical protein FDX02_08620 [Chlorobium sp.]|nr:MAG: hypothetical protein FDX02_08620 [Chlorobium sp.]
MNINSNELSRIKYRSAIRSVANRVDIISEGGDREQLLNNISKLNLVEADPKNYQKWTTMLSENENNRSLEQIAKCIKVIKQEAKIS